MRKLIGTLVIVGVCFWAANKIHLFSYAGALWSQAKQEVKNAVPTRFEIKRVRHEIAALDGDINRMIRPIAEYVATINRLKKDIQKSQEKLDEQKTDLLSMTRDLEGNPTSLSYGGVLYSAERVRAKLHRDFEGFKRLETNLQTQRKLLDAKEASLAATQDQLAKVVAKKREYELRLAQLEADEESLQVAGIGTKLQIDDSRATQIEAALADIEHRHNVRRAEVELANGAIAGDNIPINQRNQPKLDLNAIRGHLEGKTTTAVSE
jgi:peptidoglycan hydrolase CwlO-like protein